MRASARGIRRQKVRAAAKEATRALGCTCSPTYRVGTADGLDNVRVLHDAWCPLYMAGRSFVIYDRGDFRGCER